MKNQELFAHEYKAPVCKVVPVQIKGALLAGSIDNAEEDNYGEY